MSNRKYASDYRLEEYIHSDGSRGTRRIYQGEYYRFTAGLEKIHALGIQVMAASCGIFVTLLPMLFNNTQIGRTGYVLLPMAFILLPLYLVGVSGFRMLRYPQQLTREERDLSSGLFRTAAVWLALIFAVTVSGCCAYLFLNDLQPGESLCIGGIALGFLVSLVIFAQRGKVRTEAISSP